MSWLATTLGVAFASAFIPVVNIEAYLIALAVLRHQDPWLVAAVGALGQMLGKLVFWAVGRGLIDAERVRRKGRAKGRWQSRLERLGAWCATHRWGPAAMTFVSGLVGLPPFAVWSVMAGTLRMRAVTFFATGLAGRFGRFVLVVAAPGVLHLHR